MAFNTIQPMFGTGTFYTPQSNFFVDYMYTRVALTNKKNQELARFELDEQATKERGLKDEEIRLRQNITKLQNNLLNREQASISKRQAMTKKSASGARDQSAAKARQFKLIKETKDTYTKYEEGEQANWDDGQGRAARAEATMSVQGTNFLAGIKTGFAANPNYFDTNDGRSQDAMVAYWNTLSGGANPDDKSPKGEKGGTLFVKAYLAIRKDYGVDAAESFKTAVYTDKIVGQALWDEPVLGGFRSNSSEERLRLYGKAEHQRALSEIRTRRDEELADIPTLGGPGGSSSSSSTGPAPGLESNVTTDKTNQLIKEYEARLADVMAEREAQEGKRGDILERRLGRKSFAQSLTPFEYVDEDVQSILDEVLGIEDEDVRRETLEESRMMISGARGKIANEFVENQVLNETAIRGQYGFARDRMGSALQEMHQADAAAVSLRAQLKALQAGAAPEDLEAASPQIEALVANINRQERRALKAEQQHDLYGQINDQLKPLVGSERGVAAEWSSMGPRERLLVIQSLNAGAIGKASVYEDTISTTRQEIQLLEEQVRDIESDVGPRPEPRRRRGQVGPGGLGREGSRLGTGLEAPTNFEKNDHAMAALQELEDNKAALQSLLVAQNQHLTFSGEATGAIDFLVENDPAYRIEPPVSRGLGTEAPASAVLTPDEEETMFKAAGDIGQEEGKAEGVELGEKARRGQVETEARDLGVERVVKRLGEIAGEPESEAGDEEIEDLGDFLGRKEAKLEARPESEDVAEAGDRVTVPEEELEEPDYTYELRTTGEEPNRELVLQGLTSEKGPNLGGRGAPDKVKLGRDFREDETFDVAPSPPPEPEEDEESDLPDFPSVVGEIGVGEDFTPGGFEFKSIDPSEIEMDPPTKKPGGEPKITADSDKEPELWQEQYDTYIDWVLQDVGDSLVPTEPPAAPAPATPPAKKRPPPQAKKRPPAPPPIQTPSPSYFPERIPVKDDSGALTQRGVIDSLRARGTDAKSILSHLSKGFQLSHELVDAVENQTQNVEFQTKLKKLSPEDQEKWEGIWRSMTDWRENRAPPRDDDLLQNSMPEGT
jgi:hypothetical protein